LTWINIHNNYCIAKFNKKGNKVIQLLYILLVCVPTNVLTGYYSQLGQDKRISELLGKKRGGIFVDIGAHDGIRYSNTLYLEKELNWNGLCLEPHPDLFRRLAQNRSCKCLQVAIADYDGQTDFLKVINNPPENDGPDMLSGIIVNYDSRHLRRIEQEVQANGAKIEILQIPCLTLTSVLKQHNIYHIDYLSIDVEGSELQVLKGIDFDIFDIDFIDVENNFGENKIRDFLASKNFVLYENIGFDQLFRNKKYLKR
jgi:FkbM family methyltransferase